MTEQNFDQMRRAMVVSQLRTTGVNDPRVVAAMGAVPRERFVPGERISTAYAETLVPLADGRVLNPPLALGRLLNELRPEAGEKILLIGAATGYAAAVLAELAGVVVALEEDKDLLATAKAALAGVDGVTLVSGPLAKGYKAGAPYDVILFDGAVEFVPDAIVEQLADGGRLGTAILDQGVTRLATGRRTGGAFGLTPFADLAAAILPGFTKPRTFSF